VTGAISDDSPSRTTVCVRLMKRQRKLTLQVTPERVVEISLLVEAWLRKKKASLRDLQSLLGKLHFIATCVRTGRIFVSRLLNWLRKAFPPNIAGSGHKNFRKYRRI
jgi:hypothetical protein